MAVERNALARLSVALEPPYPILIGSGALAALAEAIPERRVALLSDAAVFALHGSRVEGALERHAKQVKSYTFPPGEGSKSLAVFTRLLGALAEDAFDRRSAVLALGGGVSGDLAGFVAASYLRGVAFYQLPTSLLAMVDSSIGGKTGVNLPQGKNLVGAFWQPKAVGIELDFLKTLPARIFREGAVELFKAGLLADENILKDMRNPDFRPDGDPAFLADLIRRGVQVKADIVAADETETGVRAQLNLGHTLGHALEAATHHKLSHGDSVAYGLLYAALLAKARGYADLSDDVARFLEWLEPDPLPALELADLLPYMQRDKKARSGVIRFVLLEHPGQPVLVDDLTPGELDSAWKELKAAR